MDQHADGLQEPTLFENGAEAPAFRAKPDGTLDPAGEAGWYLQREREHRGASLEDAGAATGIHPYHLEAIEYGDMTRLPNRVDAINMIGHYAQYLGFDPQPLVLHYAQFMPRPAVAPKKNHPANPLPLTSAKILAFTKKLPKMPQIDWSKAANLPGGAGGIVASIAGAVFLFGGVSWYALQPASAPPAAEIAQIDTMPTATTGEQAEVQVTEEDMPDAAELQGNTGDAAEEASIPAEETLTEAEAQGAGLDDLTAFIEENVTDAPGKKKPKKEKQAKAEDVPVAGETVQTAEGRIFGAENADSRLVLRAKAPVWVRIEDQSGNVIMTQMLMKGDTYRVPAREGLVAIARDGGLIAYEIDGQEKGILGPPGEILVGRPLDIPVLDKNG